MHYWSQRPTSARISRYNIHTFTIVLYLAMISSSASCVCLLVHPVLIILHVFFSPLFFSILFVLPACVWWHDIQATAREESFETQIKTLSSRLKEVCTVHPLDPITFATSKKVNKVSTWINNNFWIAIPKLFVVIKSSRLFNLFFTAFLCLKKEFIVTFFVPEVGINI